MEVVKADSNQAGHPGSIPGAGKEKMVVDPHLYLNNQSDLHVCCGSVILFHFSIFLSSLPDNNFF